MANEIIVNNPSNRITVNESGSAITVTRAINAISISSVGVQGVPGQQGEDGLSAYELAVQYGFTGTEEEWVLQNELDLSAKVDKTEIGNTDTNYVNIFLYNMLN